ncbi:MAG: YiiX/YebB-like N1pC/P60 family cysteine hydrolase [Pseudomonadales bacterium]|jgi:hypothetical protein|nr:YiiX/YebB-like N1pC/P60 family cysteine hydrolase [Pseudomonadales bacterium]MDP6826194.1 YiiX/YebB-like N1pC/P60 family cysteine hydrolase [Pseudomonadales bacterium]|tara:strand:- start:6195 stop:7031 length:837 start_codon:yes stop_codon:yes gene_type:complete
MLTRPIINWLTRLRPPSRFPLSDYARLREEVRPCDVILVAGRSRVSDVIRIVTQNAWTHAALYIGSPGDLDNPVLTRRLQRLPGYRPNEHLIVESQLGRGTIVMPLDEYRHDHLRLCRPRGLTGEDAQLLLEHALSRVGSEYDIRQIFDLMRFLLPWGLLPRRWRSSLFRENAGAQTKTVCSTMIAEAFAQVQFPILPLVHQGEAQELRLYRRNPRLCTPSDFDFSPYFEIIKYPFFDLSEHAHYRLLPWFSTASHGFSNVPPAPDSGAADTDSETRN